MMINTDIRGIQIDISSSEAFSILCKTLGMSYVLNEDTEFIIKKNEDGVTCLYTNRDGVEHFFDDRGDLFVALRNVAVNMFPNTLFRNADYIYSN